MKRTILFFLAALLLFSACGRQTLTVPEAPETPATVASPSGKTVVVPAATAAPTAEETGTTAAETTAAPTTAAPKTTAQHSTAAPPATTAEKATEAPRTTAAPTTEAPKPTAAPTTEAKPTAAPTTEPPKTTAAPKPTQPPTTAAPKPTEPPTTRPADTCTLRIECATILDNTKKLKAGKAAFVPKGGLILKDTAVPVEAGDTAFDVLRRACETHPCEDNCQFCQKAGGIQLEYTFTPVFETYYIEGIHQLYEKDCGAMSGWMFSVNGRFPEEGASSVSVAAGDKIVFCYTCDMGDDVGNHYEG